MPAAGLLNPGKTQAELSGVGGQKGREGQRAEGEAQWGTHRGPLLTHTQQMLNRRARVLRGRGGWAKSLCESAVGRRVACSLRACCQNFSSNGQKKTNKQGHGMGESVEGTSRIHICVASVRKGLGKAEKSGLEKRKSAVGSVDCTALLLNGRVT
jgi:hypothetical protein